jgi:hypothetical protein
MLGAAQQRRRSAIGLLSVLSLASVALSAGPPPRPGLLLGGGALEAPSKPAAGNVDPTLPTGPEIRREARPSPLGSSACSRKEPVCVSASPGLAGELSRYLAALEDARASLVGALGLPAPLPDSAGPTSGLDLYLLPGMGPDLEVLGDPPWLGSDRTSAFCRAHPSAVEWRRQAALCVAEALLYGLDAAESPHLRRAFASYLWSLFGTSTPADVAAIEFWQTNPQLALFRRELGPDSAGAGVFFRYLDRHLGAGRPGALPAALSQLARRSTPPGELAWHHEPDGLDVLRRAFAGSRETFDDFMLDFAVERAFMGSRDGGQGDPALRWLGDAGRVRFDWVLSASSLPRRVAARRPLEPFGSAYLWLALDRVALSSTLAFRANWEAPAQFRWTLVAVDAQGAPIKRYDLPFVQRATSVERTLLDYQNATGILIVGTSVGGVDLAHPVDPDHDPFEPHGFTVYLAEL